MIPCFILAGGLGTRMRSVAGDLPKILVPVGGRPFVHHQLGWLAEQGVTSVILSIGHLGPAVRSYVGDGSPWGLSVTYVDEGETLLGTAGALRLALERAVLPERFVVLYGDSYVPIQLSPVERAFQLSAQPALMTVFRNEDRWEQSNARYQDGLVVLYQKSHPDPAAAGLTFVDYGVSMLHRDVVAEMIPPGQPFDLAEVFHSLSVRGRLGGYEVAERFFEVGSPAGLRDLEAHLGGHVRAGSASAHEPPSRAPAP